MKVKYLEMWKTQRLINCLGCIFDTCFLAFLWIIGWKVIFWVYLCVSLLSMIGGVVLLKKYEGKI